MNVEESGREDTRARILDVVQDLMMERGFNAISYQDVADRVGIRKASIHYHFPTKADLGAVVMARYVDRLMQMARPVSELPREALGQAFEAFLSVLPMVADSPAKVCLGGVLGAEFETLAPEMQAEVRRFYNAVQDWLAALLERGRAEGAFSFAGAPHDVASAIVSMMEGALIIRRALADDAQLNAAMDAARALTRASAQPAISTR